MAKPKLALYWASGCGGCEIAVLDIHEKILDVAAAFDIVFWPCVMDFKYHDVRAMEDKSIDLCLFNGSIRNSEGAELAHLLRAKSKVLVAFGSCALEGGIPGLANLTTKEDIFRVAYKDTPSTVKQNGGVYPQTHSTMKEGSIEIPELWETVKSLDQVVEVEYYVPGCPPQPEQIWAVIEQRRSNSSSVRSKFRLTRTNVSWIRGSSAWVRRREAAAAPSARRPMWRAADVMVRPRT
jgi:F420-non-reducing hydrogenase small subunit